MKICGLIILGGLILFSAGCASVGFKKMELCPVGDIESSAVREAFAAAIPEEFQIINAILFQYRRQRISALGYTAVDRPGKAFRAVCLNPVGIKLFEISGDPKNTKCIFAREEFKRRENFASHIAGDIRKIYFDLIPGPTAPGYRYGEYIIFKEVFSSGRMEYRFSVNVHPLLIEKCCYQGRKRVWSIGYSNYRRKDEKLYPGDIIFNHHRYGYRLIVRLKEVCQ